MAKRYKYVYVVWIQKGNEYLLYLREDIAEEGLKTGYYRRKATNYDLGALPDFYK